MRQTLFKLGVVGAGRPPEERKPAVWFHHCGPEAFIKLNDFMKSTFLFGLIHILSETGEPAVCQQSSIQSAPASLRWAMEALTVTSATSLYLHY